MVEEGTIVRNNWGVVVEAGLPDGDRVISGVLVYVRTGRGDKFGGRVGIDG
jgi:hypothetical protein